MKNKMIAALVGVSLMSCTSAIAQELVLRAVNAFPQGSFFAKSFEQFVEKVNEESKGIIRINYLAGPSAMPPFEVGNAVRTGVVDIAHLPGAYYTSILPEADAFKLFTKSPAELRDNGSFAAIDQLHREKMNTVFLARGGASIPFHFFTTKQIDRADFSGLKIRVTPIYKNFVEALGGTAVTTTQGEVFTALERGVVDGYGSPLFGIFDFGWQEVTKYRIDPGFYAVDIGILVNQDKWNALNDQQKAALTKGAAQYEQMEAPDAGKQAAERKRHDDAGIKAISFSDADAATYRAKALDAAWASILERAPASGQMLKSLSEK